MNSKFSQKLYINDFVKDFAQVFLYLDRRISMVTYLLLAPV